MGSQMGVCRATKGEWRALHAARKRAERVLLGTRPGERREAPQGGVQGRQEQGQ